MGLNWRMIRRCQRGVNRRVNSIIGKNLAYHVGVQTCLVSRTEVLARGEGAVSGSISH
jgi:hypothetical protein